MLGAAVVPTTSDRLLAAATELFARRGYHGTSIREIALRAGANVASGHYHYGSKRELYLHVLRDQFAQARAALDRRGATQPPAALRAMPRRRLAALLEARIATILEILLGPPPGPHGALTLWEMCDPSDALPIIVAEFIRPQVQETEAIIAHLIRRPRPGVVRRAGFSIIGQVLFYRFTLPATLLLLGRRAYPRGFIPALARHITTFSLGGLERLGATRRRRSGRPATLTGRRRTRAGAARRARTRRRGGGRVR